MAEHYTKSTTSVGGLWCAKCKRQTRHRVDKGRRGPCQECGTEPAPLPAALSAEVRVACPCSKWPFPHLHSLEDRRRAAQRFNIDLQGPRRALDVPEKDKAAWPEN